MLAVCNCKPKLKHTVNDDPDSDSNRNKLLTVEVQYLLVAMRDMSLACCVSSEDVSLTHVNSATSSHLTSHHQCDTVNYNEVGVSRRRPQLALTYCAARG